MCSSGEKSKTCGIWVQIENPRETGIFLLHSNFGNIDFVIKQQTNIAGSAERTWVSK